MAVEDVTGGCIRSNRWILDCYKDICSFAKSLVLVDVEETFLYTKDHPHACTLIDPAHFVLL